MSFNGAGLGAPGVRIKRDLTEQSELWTNVKIAAVVVALCDLVLTVVLLTALRTGWWALPILGVLLGFFVGFSGLMFSARLGVGLPDWATFILGNLWAFMCFAGFAVGYLGRTKVDPAIQLLNDQIWGVFRFEPWWYLVGAALLVLFVLVVRKLKFAAAFLGAEIVAGLVLAADPDAYAQIWNVLSWIGLVYLWPIVGIALVLIAKLTHEMLFPSLEFTLKPFSLEEWRELGTLGLIAPRLLGAERDRPEPVPEQVIEVRTIDEKGKQIKRNFIPGGPEARDFYDAVHKGESFSERTASKYGVSRGRFIASIRSEFLARDWAKWNDEEFPQQGVYLSDEGVRAVEHIALARTTP